MSNTFKYLDNQSGQAKDTSKTAAQGNAAQDFLNKQLAKNKYTDVSNPDNPYAMGEGSTPSGQAYEMDLKVLNQDAIDAANKHNESLEGRIGEGKMSAEEIREKFGFAYSEDHANAKGGYSEHGGKDNGAIYDVKTGEYVGTIPSFIPQQSRTGPDEDAQGIGSFEKMQDHELQYGFRNDKRSDWDSMNDVAGAVQNILGGEEKEVPKARREEQKPIEHSAEIKQAKERVQNYEQDIMSGKTSNEIYGSNSSDQYTFDHTKGMAGIGTSPASASSQAATDATSSFLNKKVIDTKSKYNIKPVS